MEKIIEKIKKIQILAEQGYLLEDVQFNKAIE
jgi:hypothetical protein